MHRPALAHALVFVLVVAVGSGCGGGGGGGTDAASRTDAAPQVDAGPSVNLFTGSWTGSVFRYTNNADELEVYEAIGDGGAFDMTVLSGGRARTWTTLGGVSDEWDALLTVSGTTVTSTPVETIRPTRVYEYTVVGPELTLTDVASEFDFTATGATPVAATVHIELTAD